MKEFCYNWADSAGNRGEGVMEAPDKASAYQKLRQQNLIILQLQEKKSVFLRSGFRIFPQKKSLSKSNFYRQGALLIKAGIPLSETMELLSDDAGLKGQLLAGASLTTAMESRKPIYSNEEIAMIEAGEYGGSLAWAFSRLAEDFTAREQLQKSFQQAMLYPLFLCLISLVALLFIIIFILPVIFTVFQDLAIELPLPARIVMAISEVPGERWLLLVLIGLLVGWGTFWVHRWERTGRFMDQYLLNFPIVGKIWLLKDLTAFLGTLSMLLSGGIVIDRAVNHAAAACTNRYVREAFQKTGQGVSRGNSLGDSLDYKWLPPLIKKLVAAGEVSGELPDMLDYGNRYCRRAGESRLKYMEIMAEPLLITVLGIVIGFIVLSIVLPMLDLMTAYF